MQLDLTGNTQISAIKLLLQEGTWNMQLVFTPSQLAEWITTSGTVTPLQDLSSAVTWVIQTDSEIDAP